MRRQYAATRDYTETFTKKMTIKNNLAELMEREKLTQYGLERKSKVPQPTIQRLLSGETCSPKVSTLEKLAEALSSSIDEIVCGVDQNPSGADLRNTQLTHDEQTYLELYRELSKRGKRAIYRETRTILNYEEIEGPEHKEL